MPCIIGKLSISCCKKFKVGFKKIKKVIKKKPKTPKNPERPKNPTQPPRKQEPKKRKVFSPDDDKNIISFMLNNKNIRKPYLWMQMEDDEIVPGWDRKRLKKRFQNMKYNTKLRVYDLTDEDRDYLMQRKI